MSAGRLSGRIVTAILRMPASALMQRLVRHASGIDRTETTDTRAGVTTVEVGGESRANAAEYGGGLPVGWKVLSRFAIEAPGNAHAHRRHTTAKLTGGEWSMTTNSPVISGFGDECLTCVKP